MASLIVVGLLTAVTLQTGEWLVVARDADDPDALLVLGSHEWERLPAAARAAERYPDARVLLTEPIEATPSNCHRCADRVAWLHELRIEAHRIEILPDRVTNTYTEALAAAKYCRERSVLRLTLVTSAYHARRALATFRTVFASSLVEISVMPAVPPDWGTPERWWRHPYDRAYVAYELSAIAWYIVRYGISPIVRGPRPHGTDGYGRHNAGEVPRVV